MKLRNKSAIAQLLVLLCASACAVAAPNKITETRVTLTTPVSDSEAVAISALKRWPGIPLTLGEGADDAVLTSIQKIPDVRNLHFNSKSAVTSLAPISRFPRLYTLEVFRFQGASPNNPVSLAPLASCRELTKIELNTSYYRDFDSLSACSQLREVRIPNAQIPSLSFLQSTPLVEKLSLACIRNSPESLAPIAGLARLRSLYLELSESTQRQDEALAPLGKLTGLFRVGVSNAKNLSSLDFIAQCRDLEELVVYNCPNLADLDALKALPLLGKLDLTRSGMTNIEALRGKASLERLYLTETKITDLAPLKEVPNLQRLMLERSAVTDLSPIENLRTLRYLSIENTKVNELGALKKLHHLEFLDLRKSGVADLTPISGLDQLEFLNIEQTAITDLRPLHGLAGLRRIYLSSTMPKDEIAALRSALPNLGITIYQPNARPAQPREPADGFGEAPPEPNGRVFSE